MWESVFFKPCLKKKKNSKRKAVQGVNIQTVKSPVCGIQWIQLWMKKPKSYFNFCSHNKWQWEVVISDIYISELQSAQMLPWTRRMQPELTKYLRHTGSHVGYISVWNPVLLKDCQQRRFRRVWARMTSRTTTEMKRQMRSWSCHLTCLTWQLCCYCFVCLPRNMCEFLIKCGTLEGH